MQAYAEGFDILRGAAAEHLPAERRYDLDLPEIAELWRRGSVVGSWLLDLAAAPSPRTPSSRASPAASRTPAKGAGRSRRRSRRRCPPPCSPPPSSPASAPAATAASPTSCSRRCARSSAGTPRRQQPAPRRAPKALTPPLRRPPPRRPLRHGHLRRHRRPDQAQADPRPLQPRRGSASSPSTSPSSAVSSQELSDEAFRAEMRPRGARARARGPIEDAAWEGLARPPPLPLRATSQDAADLPRRRATAWRELDGGARAPAATPSSTWPSRRALRRRRQAAWATAGLIAERDGPGGGW